MYIIIANKDILECFISYTPQIPHTDDVETNENTFIHSKENDNQVTILFDPVIRRGIIRMEVLNVKDLQGVGIADDSVHYGQDERPSSVGWNKIVYYYWNGNIHHIGDEIEGNSDFDDPGHRITLEMTVLLQGSEEGAQNACSAYIQICTLTPVPPILEFVNTLNDPFGFRCDLSNRGEPIKDIDIKCIAQALVNGSLIAHLDLEGNQISSIGLSALFQGESNRTQTPFHLKRVNFSSNPLGAQSIDNLQESIRKQFLSAASNISPSIQSPPYGRFSSLTVLSLRNTKLGDRGAEIIARLLNFHLFFDTKTSSNAQSVLTASVTSANSLVCQLLSLDLSENGIGDEGAAALAGALITDSLTQSPPSFQYPNQQQQSSQSSLPSKLPLQSLNLSNNNIGNDGACSLAQALRVNKYIKSLNLDSNVIGDMGIIAISQSLLPQYSQQLCNINECDVGWKSHIIYLLIKIEYRKHSNLLQYGLYKRLFIDVSNDEAGILIGEAIRKSISVVDLSTSVFGQAIGNKTGAITVVNTPRKQLLLQFHESVAAQLQGVSIQLPSSSSSPFYPFSTPLFASNLPQNVVEEIQLSLRLNRFIAAQRLLSAKLKKTEAFSKLYQVENINNQQQIKDPYASVYQQSQPQLLSNAEANFNNINIDSIEQDQDDIQYQLEYNQLDDCFIDDFHSETRSWCSSEIERQWSWQNEGLGVGDVFSPQQLNYLQQRDKETGGITGRTLDTYMNETMRDQGKKGVNNQNYRKDQMKNSLLNQTQMNQTQSTAIVQKGSQQQNNVKIIGTKEMIEKWIDDVLYAGKEQEAIRSLLIAMIEKMKTLVVTNNVSQMMQQAQDIASQRYQQQIMQQQQNLQQQNPEQQRLTIQLLKDALEALEQRVNQTLSSVEVDIAAATALSTHQDLSIIENQAQLIVPVIVKEIGQKGAYAAVQKSEELLGTIVKESVLQEMKKQEQKALDRMAQGTIPIIEERMATLIEERILGPLRDEEREEEQRKKEQDIEDQIDQEDELDKYNRGKQDQKKRDRIRRNILGRLAKAADAMKAKKRKQEMNESEAQLFDRFKEICLQVVGEALPEIFDDELQRIDGKQRKQKQRQSNNQSIEDQYEPDEQSSGDLDDDMQIHRTKSPNLKQDDRQKEGKDDYDDEEEGSGEYRQYRSPDHTPTKQNERPPNFVSFFTPSQSSPQYREQMNQPALRGEVAEALKGFDERIKNIEKKLGGMKDGDDDEQEEDDNDYKSSSSKYKSNQIPSQLQSRVSQIEKKIDDMQRDIEEQERRRKKEKPLDESSPTLLKKSGGLDNIKERELEKEKEKQRKDYDRLQQDQRSTKRQVDELDDKIKDIISEQRNMTRIITQFKEQISHQTSSQTSQSQSDLTDIMSSIRSHTRRLDSTEDKIVEMTKQMKQLEQLDQQRLDIISKDKVKEQTSSKGLEQSSYVLMENNTSNLVDMDPKLQKIRDELREMATQTIRVLSKKVMKDSLAVNERVQQMELRLRELEETMKSDMEATIVATMKIMQGEQSQPGSG
ncbi:MAG: hypothetical protein EZS28_002833 [Streblomastix strix]|uniref:Leucine Rich Repeat family protein n=1 Tax=Streblomastix strix TaxID=222440 RepID=A0A5J4X360_9EUKA|nr:MAG: hypothetical protein EZS28_002833 [Streblomastix strix]